MMKIAGILFILTLSACGTKSVDIYDNTKDRVEVPCPDQTAQTLVLFTFGQSNSANSAEKKYSNSDRRILNYFRGSCYVAQDPLLGASGEGGSQWVITAQKLMATGNYDSIIINSFGIGASFVDQWVNGNLKMFFSAQFYQLKYNPTHFLWHQGEADSGGGTPGLQYAQTLTTLIERSLSPYPAAKFYVSLATLCNSTPNPTIRAAQQSVVNNTNVFQGPDTDTLTARYDKCHLGESDQEAVSTMWKNLISP